LKKVVPLLKNEFIICLSAYFFYISQQNVSISIKNMSKVIKVKKGLDIKLQGKAQKNIVNAERAKLYAIKPTDFNGLVPRLAIQEGDEIKAGSTLFFDKNRPEVKFTSPVAGKVVTINRGERRKILEVVVQAANTDEYIDFGKSKPADLSRDEVIHKLLQSGLWTFIIQRPYSIIANPTDNPKAIYISGFDTAPLAADIDFTLQGFENEFSMGITALKKLTEGKVNICLSEDFSASKAFTDSKDAEFHYFSGPHPTGNVGIQIHHIDSINKGEVVWVVKPHHVVSIGRLFNKGIYDVSKIIALAGSQVLQPQYYKIIGGASIETLVNDNVEKNNLRFISGDVLTGTKIPSNGFIGHYDNLITVIPEGDHADFLGWAAPGLSKYSASKTFLSSLIPKKEYKLDTNYNGCERAYVVTGQYEKVLPMDIYPVNLIKAIMAEDIDLMEKLGIYEVAEEDFALCEFVCTSKIEVQSVIRKGLEMMIKEMS